MKVDKFKALILYKAISTKPKFYHVLENLGCVFKDFSVHWAPGHQVWILPLTENREHGKAILSA